MSKLPSRQLTSQAMILMDRVLVKMLTTKTATLLLSDRPNKSHNRLLSRIVSKEATESSSSASRVTIIEIQAYSRHIWLKSLALAILQAPMRRKLGSLLRSETPTTRSTSIGKQTCHHTRIQMSTRFNCSRLTKEIFLQRERLQLRKSRPSSTSNAVTTSRPTQRLLSCSNSISTH